MVIDNHRYINHYRFYRKSILIEVTTFFLYRFLSIDIGNQYSSMIDIDYYRLSVYRLTTSGVKLLGPIPVIRLREVSVTIELTAC